MALVIVHDPRACRRTEQFAGSPIPRAFHVSNFTEVSPLAQRLHLAARTNVFVNRGNTDQLPCDRLASSLRRIGGRCGSLRRWEGYLHRGRRDSQVPKRRGRLFGFRAIQAHRKLPDRWRRLGPWGPGQTSRRFRDRQRKLVHSRHEQVPRRFTERCWRPAYPRLERSGRETPDRKRRLHDSLVQLRDLPTRLHHDRAALQPVLLRRGRDDRTGHAVQDALLEHCGRHCETVVALGFQRVTRRKRVRPPQNSTASCTPSTTALPMLESPPGLMTY